ncbi:MAG: tripartite tricarboxylate transporter substrate binding protein [Proteobacteria bacterium]|nr:tripartite tricarboxylate transporter substrate binding protein [Pseudomonadota bacterium]
MIRRRTVALGSLAALASSSLVSPSARAQQAWPAKPIRLIVPYGPGGSADHVARLYAEMMSGVLGQQIVVEDKPGASGGVGAQMVATSPPDGYTLLLAPTAVLAITPAARKVPYNPDDLVAVARLSMPILVVTITNALGAKTWAEFVALAKQNPGKFWFGSSGLGTITHLTGEVLSHAAGIEMQHAPYKTIVDATGDLFDGRIQMVFDPSFVPYAKAGKVRAVIVDGPVRLADLPDTPTAAEAGLDLKGFRARSWFGLFAPRGTPEPVLKRLSDAAGQVAALPEIRENLLMVAQNVEHQPYDTFAAQVRDDQAYFAKLLKELDIKLE